MFDDLKKLDSENAIEEAGKKPSTPGHVEDIFASTSKSERVPLSTSPHDIGANSLDTAKSLGSPSAGLEGLQSSPMPMALDGEHSSRGGKKKILTGILTILIISILGIGGWLLYDAFLNNPKVVDKPVVGEQIINDSTNEFGNEEYASDDYVDERDNENEVVEAVDQLVVIDSDNDGLSDSEEAVWGTDKDKPDTDEDGLFDREEVMIYKTNPLITDSDSDGYPDGEEVQAGYDPNGPGRLFSDNL